MNELALFAGAGGGVLGGYLLGWETLCAVERDAYAAQILAQRQNDRCLKPFPIWSDVCSFDGIRWRGAIDVISGGFPCQDISPIGKKAGIDGEKSGLWSEMARIIGEVRPRYVLVENSSHLVGRGLIRVLADLATMGFHAEWGVIGADDIGAEHERKRLFLVAYTPGEPRIHKPQHPSGAPRLFNNGSPWAPGTWDEAEPKVRRMDDGLAFGVDRFKAIGNGQVPAVAATAFQLLSGR